MLSMGGIAPRVKWNVVLLPGPLWEWRMCVLIRLFMKYIFDFNSLLRKMSESIPYDHSMIVKWMRGFTSKLAN